MSIWSDTEASATRLLQKFCYLPEETKTLLRTIINMCQIAQKLETEKSTLQNRVRELEEKVQNAEGRLRDKLRLAEQENATLKRELKSLMERT